MQKPIVNHVTFIRMGLAVNLPIHLNTPQEGSHRLREAGILAKAHYDKLAAIMEALTELKFVFSTDKNYLYAKSEIVGARDAKEYLLAKGFKDQDFQIYLEYSRGWGMM
ncbi:hypothetical protein [Anaerospora hongkongensis]|uniref:hypothetical protein n=1 Tax=Anaerospora hongkongensis TaxID=244830 RepID=UPI002FD9280E